MKFSNIEELKSLLKEYGLKEELIGNVVKTIIRLYICCFLSKEEIDNIILGILRKLDVVRVGEVYSIYPGVPEIRYGKEKHVMLKYEDVGDAVEEYLRRIYVEEKEKIKDILDVIGLHRFAYLVSFEFSRRPYGNGIECYCNITKEFIREHWKDLCRLAEIVYGYCKKSDSWITIAYPWTFIEWLLKGKALPKVGKMLSYFMALRIIYDYCSEKIKGTFNKLKEAIEKTGLTLYEFELVAKDLQEKGLISRFKESDPPFLCLTESENIKEYALSIVKEKQNPSIYMLPYFEILKPTDDIREIKTKLRSIFKLFRNNVFGVLPYIDKTTFELLSLIPKDLGIKIIISFKDISDEKLREYADKLKEYRPSVEIVEIRQEVKGAIKTYLHRRWLSDNEVFIDLDVDLKLKPLKNKEVHIEVQRAYWKKDMIVRFNELWEKSDEELNRELGEGEIKIVKKRLYP